MKRIISAIIAGTLLFSCFVFNVAAGDGNDIRFYLSFSDRDDAAAVSHDDETAALTPGERIKVNIYLTDNDGIWAGKFILHYDTTILQFASYGIGNDVFSAFEALVTPNPENGCVYYYAESNDITENKTTTGRILTVFFDVLKHEKTDIPTEAVYLEFPNEGVGWFFSTIDISKIFDIFTENKLYATVNEAPPEYTPGDINSDGKINGTDSNLLLKILGGKNATELEFAASDVNCDGKVNGTDSNILLKMILN